MWAFKFGLDDKRCFTRRSCMSWVQITTSRLYKSWIRTRSTKKNMIIRLFNRNNHWLIVDLKFRRTVCHDPWWVWAQIQHDSWWNFWIILFNSVQLGFDFLINNFLHSENRLISPSRGVKSYKKHKKMSRSVRAETRQRVKDEKKHHISHLFSARKWWEKNSKCKQSKLNRSKSFKYHIEATLFHQIDHKHESQKPI